ncbi:MAG: hypothetical protein ACYSTG_10075 [Planctomycetota bacterium]
MKRPSDKQQTIIILVLLAAATLAVYWQARGHEFIAFDDDLYVTANKNVQSGLTWRSIKWAFTTNQAYNWHPLVWISHMLDCQLYDLNPAGHHFTNVLLHIVNTLLLFLVLNRMTGSIWRSAFVAALFALHPLHVESVAWVSERKDVLSTFFWILTMWFYVRYVQRPRFATYLPIMTGLWSASHWADKRTAAARVGLARLHYRAAFWRNCRSWHCRRSQVQSFFLFNPRPRL